MTFYIWFRELIRIHLWDAPGLIPTLSVDSPAAIIVHLTLARLSQKQFEQCYEVLKPL